MNKKNFKDLNLSNAFWFAAALNAEEISIGSGKII